MLISLTSYFSLDWQPTTYSTYNFGIPQKVWNGTYKTLYDNLLIILEVWLLHHKNLTKRPVPIKIMILINS